MPQSTTPTNNRERKKEKTEKDHTKPLFKSCSAINYMYTAANTNKGKLTANESQKEITDLEPSPNIGLKQSVMTILSLMVGIGIFGSVGIIHLHLKSVAATFSLWLVSAGIALCGALSYAELGTTLPENGGEAVYLERAWGAFAGAHFEWASVALLRPAFLGFLGNAFALHAVLIWQAWNLASPEDWLTDEEKLRTKFGWVIPACGSIMLLLIYFVACAGPRAAEKASTIFTYGSLLSLASIVVVGTGWGFLVHPDDLKQAGIDKGRLLGQVFSSAKDTGLWPFSRVVNVDGPNDVKAPLNTLQVINAFSQALVNGLWAMDGWNNLNMISGRVINPSVTLPRAIWLAIGIVTALYLFVQIGYYGVVPYEILQSTRTAAVEWGRVIFSAFGDKWTPLGATVMGLFVMGSTVGSSLSGLGTSAEVLKKSAERGSMPAFLGRVSPKLGVPVAGFGLQCLLGLALMWAGSFLSGKTYSGLLTVCTFPMWIYYGAAVLGLFVIRWRERALARPYKVTPVAPIVFLASTLFMIVSAVVDKDSRAFVGICVMIMLVGLGVCLLVVKPKHQQQSI